MSLFAMISEWASISLLDSSRNLVLMNSEIQMWPEHGNDHADPQICKHSGFMLSLGLKIAILDVLATCTYILCIHCNNQISKILGLHMSIPTPSNRIQIGQVSMPAHQRSGNISKTLQRSTTSCAL
jgi:hypothetical protein